MEYEATYLEEFLASVESLPNDVRRDFELMRNLDKETTDLGVELQEMQDAYIARARERFTTGLPTMLQHDGKAKVAENIQNGESSSTSQNQETQPSSRVGLEPMDVDVSPPSSAANGQIPAIAAHPVPPALIEGSTYCADEDPEGALLLAEIDKTRIRIDERMTEKVAIANNLCSVLSKVSRKLESDLAFFETDLRGCGDFDHVAGALPGSEVAFRPTSNGEDLLLGRVTLYYADIGAYDIADVDDSQRYHVPEGQVTVLDLVDSSRRVSKGEPVYAVYPDTTAFYLATVAAAPRRGAVGAEQTLTVQFQGDEPDSSGQVPLKVVPLKYVIRA